MRKILLAVVLSLACASWAQTPARPPNLQPIPEPPAPPPGMELDPALEPQVTIIKRGIDTVEEYRIGGRLYMMRVIPPHGVPYFLIDHRGDGTFSRQDSFDSGTRVPMWVIRSF
ncbi:MAG: DUF2782 domain-containing protein [Burkholderiales bacterium]|nr:DUF2782 domain-containing protein [Burkholderiales bacterium]